MAASGRTCVFRKIGYSCPPGTNSSRPRFVNLRLTVELRWCPAVGAGGCGCISFPGELFGAAHNCAALIGPTHVLCGLQTEKKAVLMALHAGTNSHPCLLVSKIFRFSTRSL